MNRLLLLGGVLLLGACVPKRVSAECERRVSDCLKNCPNDPAPGAPFDSGKGLNDSRNACARACQSQCE